MTKKVNIITLGCSKNLVDSENLLGELKARGMEVMHESNDPSDVIIINTCGFIGDAKEESVDTILQYAEAKKEGQFEKKPTMKGSGPVGEISFFNKKDLNQGLERYFEKCKEYRRVESALEEPKR